MGNSFSLIFSFGLGKGALRAAESGRIRFAVASNAGAALHMDVDEEQTDVSIIGGAGGRQAQRVTYFRGGCRDKSQHSLMNNFKSSPCVEQFFFAPVLAVAPCRCSEYATLSMLPSECGSVG